MPKFDIIMSKLIIAIALILFPLASAFSQTYTQSVRGTVLDRESQQPLIGANVFVEKTLPLLGATTDIDGRFVIEHVPVGRHTIVVSYLGYEPSILGQVQVTSGKQIVLEFELLESTIKLEEAVVRANDEKSRVINEMAMVSARGFSVEETGRYASSLSDPARMAQNFAGVSVSGGSSDLFNEIIVRGNSPRGVLWRLEGIEIPNPNHFGALGNTGGGISMLSSSTLASSDFYTGAFPAEFGNATSGVFDLNLRKGNSEKREYSFMAGLLGLEVSMEGPFSTKSNASYLFNIRYSTLGLLEATGLSPAGDVLPKYGDISFNINVPTKKAGSFSLFGLGGANSTYHKPEADSTAWEESSEGNFGFDEKQKMATLGLVHKYLLTEKSYLRTVLSASIEKFEGEGYVLDKDNDYMEVFDYRDNFKDNTFRLSSTYTQKINAKQTIKAGLILSHKSYDFLAEGMNDDTDQIETLVKGEGSAEQLQMFAQWKYRFTDELTFTGGLHYNYYALNDKYSIEPRTAVKWQLNDKHSISGAVGLHSKSEHPVFYYTGINDNGGGLETPNLNLDYTKSLHTVLGYEVRFSKVMRISVEAYYQHLYDVPVQADITKTGSMLNVVDVWDAVNAGAAVNGGTGRNIGIDFTFEKNYSHNYYLLFTGSVFDSKYTTLAGEWYNTRFSSKYQSNILAGKEWKVGKTGDKTIGLDAKFIVNGGERTTPIDLVASEAAGETVRFNDRRFSESLGTYYRIDIGIRYKINRPKFAQTLSLDIQNVTGHQNIQSNFYNVDTGSVDYYLNTGFFPVLNYRIEF
jgi:hypothetical protein